MASTSDRVKGPLDWVYGRPTLFPIGSDLAFWILGLLVGGALKMALRLGDGFSELVIVSCVALCIHTALGYVSGMYRHRWRVSSFEEVVALGYVWCSTAVVIVSLTFATRQNGSDLPTSGVITGSLVALVAMAFSRFLWRRFWEENRRPNEETASRTLVFGAGEGGAQIVRSMLLDPDCGYLPVALLDDDPAKRQRCLQGINVMGTREDLARVSAERNAEVLLIAIPSANSSLISALSEMGKAEGLEVRVLPAASEIVGLMTAADVRPPTVEDLLGRDPVEIDLGMVADYIRGKRVLVTGAGGSIGSELSRQIRGFAPAELYLLDRDESALHGLQLSMEGRALLDTDMLVVADIRDRARVLEIFETYRPEVVFHTAALKHLTLLENHPEEGMKTNVLGTKNLLDAARTVGVESFVNISTDKAADPTSVLGATKLAAERLTAQAAQETGVPYVSVRFGNVLGSRGSVLPTFLGQLEQGKPLTVTDPEVTRYFMTIPEAVRLVVQAGAIGEGGEVMILDMGEPVKIVDLANQLISRMSPGTEIVFTGLRPGEKKHEVLIGAEEVGAVRSHPRITHTVCEPGFPADALAHIDESAVENMATLLAENA